MKKLSAFVKTYKSLLTRLAILAFLLIALPLTIYLNSQRQDNRQRAAEGTDYFCRFDEFIAPPDWLLENNTLGSTQKLYQPGDPNYEDVKNEVKPGPIKEAGSPYDTTQLQKNGKINYNIEHGLILPVRYDPTKDKIRYDYSVYEGSVSSWSRLLGRFNQSYFSTFSSEISSRKISSGVLLKYDLIRMARDGAAVFISQKTGETWSTAEEWDRQIDRLMNNEYASKGITLQTLSDNIGFDVTGLDLRKWDATDAALRKQNMISETASCSVIPTPKPTSTTPINCEEKLMIPPVGHTVNFPPYTPNNCITDGGELPRCGEYWVSGWCNNAGNATAQQNAVYACRGWSQTGTGAIDNKNRFMLYYTGRLNTMTDDEITTDTPLERRRQIWNAFMTELKNGTIAYPWEHGNTNKPAEEIRNNALEAASRAIFGKSWGAVKEQERMNNCPTTWDTPIPSAPVSITPSISPPPDGEDDPITNDGETNKDINPKVYKDKAGNIHVTWLTQPDSVKYSRGTWNGTRYAFSTPITVGTGCVSQGCAPSIAVNDDNVIAIAWAGTNGIKLVTGSIIAPGGTPKTLTQMGTSLTPSMTVDRDGNFHIVADGDFTLKYCLFNPNGNNTACGKYLETDNASSKPEIAIDSEDNVHIVAGKNGVHYLTIPAGATEFTDKVISSGNGQQITADMNGNVYLVWSEDFDIHYCKKTIDSDCTSSNTRVIQEENGTNPSIGVTDSGGIILAYNAGGQRMKYSKYLDGTWGQTTLFGQQGAVGVDVSPISFDSKLSAVWSANWDIWHRNFTFGDGTAFDLTLLLDGIGAAGDYTNRTANDRSNKDPRHPSRSLAVQFFNEQDQLVYTKIGTVTYNEEGGNFKGVIPLGRDISEGRYYVKVKMDQYLVKTLSFFRIEIGEVNTHQPITLITGDTDGNNELNLLDYNIIDGCYKDIRQEARSCDEELGRLSDLNDDGNVNQIDYNLFVRELPAEKGQ